MREILFFNAIQILQKHNFRVETFLHSNSCFDLIAKKQEKTLLIKVLSNIDSFRHESADELKKVAGIFSAIPLILGEKTKKFELIKNIIYERYNINVVNMQTFEKLVEQPINAIHYFKGKQIVELNSEKLQQIRKQKKLSLNELAEKIGITKESLYRFEQGKNTSLETGKKLEKVLKADLIKEFDLFKQKPLDFKKKISINDPVFQRLQKIGMKLNVFQHSPFNASNEMYELLIGKASNQDLKKKVEGLEKTKSFFNSESLIITKNTKKKLIKTTPIIEEQELYSITKSKDLMEILQEKKKKHD